MIPHRNRTNKQAHFASLSTKRGERFFFVLLLRVLVLLFHFFFKLTAIHTHTLIMRRRCIFYAITLFSALSRLLSSVSLALLFVTFIKRLFCWFTNDNDQTTTTITMTARWHQPRPFDMFCSYLSLLLPSATIFMKWQFLCGDTHIHTLQSPW